MSRSRVPRPRPVVRAKAVAVVCALVVLAGACSDDGAGGAAPGDGADGAAETTAPSTLDGADAGGDTGGDEATAEDGDEPAPPVPPPGYRLVVGPDVGVVMAVPEGWDDLDLDGDDLAELQGDLADDPQLAGILAQGGAMLDGAGTVAALGPGDGAGRDLAVAVQLGIVLPTVPDALVAQLEQQLVSLGASEVDAETVTVPGLPEGARGLAVAATLDVEGRPARVRVLMVPASTGIVVVTVRADDAVADAVLASVTAS